MSAPTSAAEWQNLVRRGATLLQQGQARPALDALRQAERLAPAERDVRYWLANALRMAGQRERAEGLLRGLLAERASDLDASFALAFLLRDAGSARAAADVLRDAADQHDRTPQQLLQIAGFLRDSNEVDAAIDICERVAALQPGRADLHFKLARLQLARGDFERARAELGRTLDLDPGTGPAWIALAQQTRFRAADDPWFAQIEQAAAQALGEEADLCVAFAHGKALDDLGRWPEAWREYRRGNELARCAQPWNGGDWQTFVERAGGRAAGLNTGAGAGQRRAVFIVGMPRSGTTLLEQMLDRHPRISGRGELNFLEAFNQARGTDKALSPTRKTEMGDALWAQMRQQGPADAVYVDKNPLNFRYLDLLFEILPEARVIHVVRDGRASCLSCYFQLFAHPATAFSNDLADLEGFYAGYRKLMGLWEMRYADRIERVRYADLVRDPKAALEPVLRFIGVDWDDAVTDTAAEPGVVRSASAWQARQPVHTTSVERWRHYYEQAPEFFDRIAAVDARYD